jgi:EAL domain-containing protein (putative c-di-GMP-specific phosphodiesterase class I)
VIDTDQLSAIEATDSLQLDLGQAVARHELRLEYQPVIRTSDGRVIGLEALIRWHHPERGLISPAVLIPLAERSGDIVEIGQWVLEHACVDRHRWESREGDDTFVMAVNVSAHQLMAPGFLTTVRNILSLTRTDPKDLCIEVTESAYVQDSQRALTVLSGLKELGIQLALDDFGTGYSSLSYLMDFPIDIVKVDQKFIATLTDSDASRAIVTKTIELAHLLNLLVVCEGVETAEQDREVVALATDYRQGFYFSRPMTPEMIDEITGKSEVPWSIVV